MNSSQEFKMNSWLACVSNATEALKSSRALSVILKPEEVRFAVLDLAEEIYKKGLEKSNG